MKVIKPLDLSLQYKTYTWQGEKTLSVSIIAGFYFDSRELILEQHLWQALPEMLGQNKVLDDCMPKLHGELLLSGKCYAQNSQPVSSSAVAVRVGEITKELAVYGDRYWGLLGISEAEPFTEMPLDYEHAFGGNGFEQNPVGKGIEEVDYFGEKRVPLPNIELPDQAISAKGQRPTPASFAPIDMMWQPRASRTGTYDEKWLSERAPDYADDLDWLHFNTAPEDQWLEDCFQGNESISVINMHPDKPSLDGMLPAYRTRCFVEKVRDFKAPMSSRSADKADRDFVEINMRAETLWLFPERETGVLIYRGTLPVAADDACDITHMIVGYENLADAPRSVSHYEQAMIKRLDPDKGYLYMMNTVDMIAEGQVCGFARMMKESMDKEEESAFGLNMKTRADAIKQQAEDRLTEQGKQLRNRLEIAGVDPQPFIDKLSLEKGPLPGDPEMQDLLVLMEKILPGCTGDNLKELDFTQLDLSAIDMLSNKLLDIANSKKEDARQQIVLSIDQLKKILVDSESMRELVEPKIKALEVTLADLDKKPELPRPPSTDSLGQIREQVQQVEQQFERLRKAGVAEAELPVVNIDLDEIEKNLQFAADSIKENYLSGAHYVEGRPPHKVPLDIVRYRFMKRLDAGDKMADRDYAGIDLSHQNLSGIDLSGCYLEYANLTGANLSGSNLSKAVLAHANLSGANLKAALLSGANLGDIDFTGADLSGADLSNTRLSKSRLVDAKFVACNLAGIGEILEADLTGVDMSDSTLGSVNFIEIPMNGARFCNAKLAASTFINCHFSRADFTGAVLDECNWIGAQADEAIFDSALMKNNRFPDYCSLQNTSFRKALIDCSNFRDTNLQGADFTESHFEMADFSGANLQKAVFYHAIGRRSQFIKADLGGANMQSMNMMEGSLMKARLTSADFSYSNLYAVEFMGATVGETDFRQANLDMSKLQAWRPSR